MTLWIPPVRARVAVAVVAVVLALSATARADWRESEDSIRRACAVIQSIQADFVMTKEMAILSRPLVSHGRFAFAAPNSMRWEYTDPLRSVTLMDAGRLARYAYRDGRYAPDQSVRTEAMRQVLEEINAWMAGRFEDSQVFAPSFELGDSPRVLLTPRDISFSRFVERIEITLDETPGAIRSIAIIENSQSVTRIQFASIRLNEPLPDGLFRLNP